MLVEQLRGEYLYVGFLHLCHHNSFVAQIPKEKKMVISIVSNVIALLKSVFISAIVPSIISNEISCSRSTFCKIQKSKSFY